MSSIDHQFETTRSRPGEEKDARAASSGWLRRSSLTRKLNIAVLGNTIVLALVAAALLIGTFYLGQGGHAQAVIASIEVRTNNAAIALVDVIEALEEDDAQTAQEGLDLAYETLSDPIAFAGDRMPDNVGPRLVGYRDTVDALRGDLAVYRGSDLTRFATRAEALYRDMSVFAVDYHDEAAASADRLFGSISTFLIGFVILFASGVAVSLFWARAIILNVVGSVRSITASMQGLADGDTKVAIPGQARNDELGDMARALTVFQSATLSLRDLTAERARDAETRLEDEKAANAQAQGLRSEQSAVLSDLAQGFEVSVGEVIASVQSAADTLRSTSAGMVDLATDSVGQSSEATGAMESATRNVTAAAAATDEFALSITEISHQATASASLAREANELVGSA
ncbi:MAG: HAMP domain-containing protein, partial [Pseudomonadota bacterium]